MGWERQFNDELTALFDRHRNWLIAGLYSSLGVPRHGRPHNFRRDHVEHTLDSLLSIIVEAPPVKRTVGREFDDRYQYRETFRSGRFRGRDAKKRAFNEWWWYTKDLPYNAVYVYRGGSEELYAGSTINGADRAGAQFETFRGQGAKFVDVYLPHTKRNLVSLECLAIHRFSPRHNRVRAGRRKGAFERCPVCTSFDAFRDQILSAFGLD